MEDQSIQFIRESTRNLLNLNRRKQKYEESDVRRSLEHIRITPEIISEISSKLKTKSSNSAKDLGTLKNGLMEPKNIEICLTVQGALRGLIKELTGANVKKQCLSAGCLCNLALGDSRACSIIAKAAGSYLSAALDNLTVELAVTCAWALGNLAGSDPKVCYILLSQGALNKLSEVYTNEDVQEAALYAVVHFVYQLKDKLRSEQLHKVLQMITKLEISMSSSQILFFLSCHKHFTEHVSEELLHKILIKIPILIQSHETCRLEIPNVQNDLCCELAFLLRTLANSGRFDDILTYFVMYCCPLKSLLAKNNATSQSALWLLGNMFNYCSDKELFCKFVT